MICRSLIGTKIVVYLDDFNKLINTAFSREQRLLKRTIRLQADISWGSPLMTHVHGVITYVSQKHLSEHTASRPNINGCCVFSSTKYELWSSVVSRTDVRNVWFAFYLKQYKKIRHATRTKIPVNINCLFMTIPELSRCQSHTVLADGYED